jgi:multimeric flavodoxin WrbA
VLTRPALSAGPADVLAADAVLLGTPANIGYMSGALKHFFDVVYYPCLQDTRGLAYGMYVHGNDDTAGARSSVARVATGLRWRQVAEPVEVVGAPGRDDLDAVRDLGATLGAHALGLAP